MSPKSFLTKITNFAKGKIKKYEEDTPAPPTSITVETNESENPKNWMEENLAGQLSVDVYQTEKEIIIQSPIAGASEEDLDISITNDMITIRGKRELTEQIPEENYFYKECYWGPFSRSIILPTPVKIDEAVAEFQKGILTIRLPKATISHTIKINVDDGDETQ